MPGVSPKPKLPARVCVENPLDSRHTICGENILYSGPPNAPVRRLRPLKTSNRVSKVTCYRCQNLIRILETQERR